MNPGTGSMMVSPTYPMAKKTLLPTFQQLLEDSKLHYTLNQTDRLFKLTDFNSHVWVVSGDNPESLKGPNLSAVYVDEPFIQNRDVYIQVLGRIRDPKAKRLSLILTGTPEGLGWGYEEFIENQKDDREVIIGKTMDNPALPPTYIKSLEDRYDTRLRKMYLEGIFIDLAGNIINIEWFQYFNPEEMPKDCQWDFTIDTAYGKKNSDFSVALCYTVHNKKMYIKNISRVNLSFPAFVQHLENFVEENGDYRSRIIIEPKATGISVVQELKDKTSLNVIEDRPPVESKIARATAVTAKIEAGRVLLLRGAPWLRNFLFECSQFGGSGRGHDDQVDCLVMALSRMILEGRTFVKSFGKTQTRIERNEQPARALYGPNIRQAWRGF